MLKKNNHRGYTLLEILVAMLIATTLMLAVVRLFTRVGETFELNAQAAEVMEASRVALRFIKNDLIHAGYLGCVMTSGMDREEYQTRLQSMISDQPASPLGVWGTNGASGAPDQLNLFYVQDLDIRVLDNDPRLLKSLIVESKNVFDDADNPVIDRGDWLAVYNCYRATPFILTNTPSIQSANNTNYDGAALNNEVSQLSYEIGQSINGFMNLTLDPMAMSPNYGYFGKNGGAAMVGKYYQVSYLVANSIIDGGATTSLFRLVNGEVPSMSNEMVRLVDDFQIQYGLDTDGDGLVDRYQDNFNGIAQIPVTVRVTVSITDGSRTQTLVNVVKLRNKEETRE